jgi:hypothetical protein
MIALVPYAPPARAARINITLDESLLGRVDRAAEAVGETRSGYLAGAARRRLAEESGASEAAASTFTARATGAPANARLDEPARRFRGAKPGRARRAVSRRKKSTRA